MTIPSDIADLALWLKGDTGLYTDAGTTPAVNHGDLIQQWSDQSGNGNHATQATSGNRPTLSTATVNGKNVVAFDAASAQFLALPDLFNGATSGEIFFVVKTAVHPPVNTAYTGWCVFGSNPGGALPAHFPYTDGVVYDSWGLNVRSTVGDIGNLATNYFVYNVYTNTNDWRVFKNKAFIKEETTFAVVGWTPTPLIGQSEPELGNYYFNGSIAEIVAFSRKLTDSERDEINNYLGVARYNIWGTILPNATIDAGGWEDDAAGNTDLHSPLADEDPDTWIVSPANPVNETVKLGLTDIGTLGTGDLIFEIDAEQV